MSRGHERWRDPLTIVLACVLVPLAVLLVGASALAVAWLTSHFFQHREEGEFGTETHWWSTHDEEHFGPSPLESGWDASWVGDANGDGTDDFLLYIRNEPVAPLQRGVVRVISGRDRVVWMSLEGWRGVPSEAVRPAGDVNGDGCSDLLVLGRSIGGPEIISGRDGKTLSRLPSVSAVSRCGDIDGDGNGEILLGDRYAHGGGRSRGEVRVVSGADGTVLRTHGGELDGQRLGAGVGDLCDVDGDSTEDYALSGGETGEPGLAFVRVYSGRSGTLIWENRGPRWEAPLWIKPTRDRDGDGLLDLVMGEAGQIASLQVLSGKDGSVLSRDDRIDPQVGGGWGDFDGDGEDDLLRLWNREVELKNHVSRDIRLAFWREGYLEVVSGRDGSALLRIDETWIDANG